MNLPHWIETHEVLLATLGGIGLVLFVVSLVAIPLVVAYMPPDYYGRPKSGGLPKKPFRQVLHILKNVLGSGLLLAGLVMLVLPGQGLLTILIGLSLIDFPGKHRLQVSLVRLKGIRRSIAWIRRKAHRPPLAIPPKK